MKKLVNYITMVTATALLAAALSCCATKQTEAALPPNASVLQAVTAQEKIVNLEDGLSIVRHDGDFGFDDFLAQGGASSDAEAVQFLAEDLLSGFPLGGLLTNGFGCSTLAVESTEGGYLFGRNFDWNTCEAIIVESHPDNGYASLSTVNMSFLIDYAGGGVIGKVLELDAIRTLAALYAPLDGMNEAGLAVSVNMIQDSEKIDQNTEKPDLTTTTAIRLLLDRAGSVEEALELLGQYDLHGSMGMMVHFAMADNSGRSVVVEYIDNEMVVTETPAVTNFYLAEGKKHGIGTQQSHLRFNSLTEQLSQSPQMDTEQLRDVMDSVSKDNYEEFASTEWTVVMNLSTQEAHYYHRENYTHGYAIQLSAQ